MTPKEAIEVLTDNHTSIGTTKCDEETWKKLQPAIDSAILALERQISKKPIITDDCPECGKDICEGKDCPTLKYGDGVFVCPNCKTWVKNEKVNDDFTDRFCAECGQAIDWSG